MSSNKLKQLALALLSAPLFFAASGASAAMIWQDFSLSYLQGNNYNPQTLPTGVDTQAEKRRVITFEHASGHDWGGTFLFVDRLFSRDSEFTKTTRCMARLRPTTISCSRAASSKMYSPAACLKSAATTTVRRCRFNRSNGNSFENILLGGGVSLAVPGASFFNVTLYHRLNDDQALDQTEDNPDTYGSSTVFPRGRPDSQQLTVTWRFDFLNDMMRFDGFMDYATGFDFESVDGSTPGSTEASLNFTPQLKMDMGSMFGYEAKKLWVGVEWVMWNSKFGVDGWNENNPNVLVKWHF